MVDTPLLNPDAHLLAVNMVWQSITKREKYYQLIIVCMYSNGYFTQEDFFFLGGNAAQERQ